MATKLLSVRPDGRIRRRIVKPSTDQRIVELHKQLGSSTYEAYRKLQFLGHKIEAKQFFTDSKIA